MMGVFSPCLRRNTAGRFGNFLMGSVTLFPTVQSPLAVLVQDPLLTLWLLTISNKQLIQALTQVSRSSPCSVARSKKRRDGGSMVYTRPSAPAVQVRLLAKVRPLDKVRPLAKVRPQAKVRPLGLAKYAAASQTSQTSAVIQRIVQRTAVIARCQRVTYSCVAFRAKISRS